MLEYVIVIVALSIFVRVFLIQLLVIPSGSMEPTLLIGDFILANRLAYGIRNPFTNNVLISTGTPKYDDIVVFKCPQNLKKDFVKRIIGLPNDKVQIVDKKFYINEQFVKEFKYLTNRNFGPVIVPEDSYFVMGDNYNASYDSRNWGCVPMKYLKGKAFLIFFSLAGLELFDKSYNIDNCHVRWNRLGKIKGKNEN